MLTPIALAEEACHNCNHEDRPICEVIRVAEENTKNTIKFKTGATVSLLIAIKFAFAACLFAINKDNASAYKANAAT